MRRSYFSYCNYCYIILFFLGYEFAYSTKLQVRKCVLENMTTENIFDKRNDMQFQPKTKLEKTVLSRVIF